MAKSIAHTHRPCFSRIRSYFIIFRTLAMATAARMLCTRPHIQFAYLRATTTSNWPYGLRQQREPDCANPYILSNNPNGHILRPQFYSPSACVVFVPRKKNNNEHSQCWPIVGIESSCSSVCRLSNDIATNGE